MKATLVRWSSEVMLWGLILCGLVTPIFLWWLKWSEEMSVWSMVRLVMFTFFSVATSVFFVWLRAKWRKAGCPDTMRINL